MGFFRWWRNRGSYQGVYMSPEQVVQRELAEVRELAQQLGWTIEMHRKGYFIHYGPVPGRPPHAILGLPHF